MGRRVCDFFQSLRADCSDRSLVKTIVTRLVDAARQPADIDKLVGIMHRRKQTLLAEQFAAGKVQLRPGMRDLAIAAQEEHLKLALISSMPKSWVVALVARCFGTAAPESVAAIFAAEPSSSGDPEVSLYSKVLAGLGVAAANCLAIDSRRSGLADAVSAGVPALLVQSGDNSDAGCEPALFVVGDILELIFDGVVKPAHHLTADERARLVTALGRLHAGQIDVWGGLDRGAVMKVSDILEAKGSVVKTISGEVTLRALAEELRSEKVGAMVVTGPSGGLEGIISERDLARGLAEHGANLVVMTVRQLMTKSVITCSPDDSIAGISKVMTQRRIRHLPVMEKGALVGLISIGDILKYRIEEIQLEASILRDYAIARG